MTLERILNISFLPFPSCLTKAVCILTKEKPQNVQNVNKILGSDSHWFYWAQSRVLTAQRTRQ